MTKTLIHKLTTGAGVVIVGSVLAALITFAQVPGSWQEPTVAPPEGNTPTPLNVGSIPQTKDAGLWLNIGGAQVGLIVDQGNVGIGARTPGSKLVVSGQGDFMNNRVKGVATPIDGLDAVNKDYIDALRAGGAGGSLALFGKGTTASMGSTPQCPTGWKEVYQGYGPHWRAILIYGQPASGAAGASGGQWTTTPPPDRPQNPSSPTPGEPGDVPTYNPGPPPAGPTTGGPGSTPPSGGQPQPPSAPFRNDLLPPLGMIQRAYAQTPGVVSTLLDAALGSDSVCSVEEGTTIPAYVFSQMGTPIGSPGALTANACDSATGSCNRCRVCVVDTQRVGP